jgi:nitroreductase
MVRGHVVIAEQLSWGLGWGVQHTDEGDCFWQFGGGEGAPFQNFALAFRERGIGVVIMTNGAYGESVFADPVTPKAIG